MTSPDSPPLPDALEIQPLSRPPRVTVRVPGSKSISNRALVLSALADDGCTLRGALRSEDVEVMVEALRTLGFHVRTEWADSVIHVAKPPGTGIVPVQEASLHVANSGTSMRFLAALVALGVGRFRLDGVPRMRERPIEDLLAALRQLGVSAESESGNGCPPIVIQTRGIRGGSVRIRGDVSSQFLSGLLMAVPLAAAPSTIEVDGPLVSRPYVDMTVTMMRAFGARIEEEGNRFHVPGGQRYGRREYEIEPDASAASYFLGAAAVTGGTVTVSGLGRCSLQGDVAFADALTQMGCSVVWGEGGITVAGAPLRGVTVDMNAISDTVMTLAAVACFASGPTTIRNVAHVRHKETDRLAALAIELRKLGATVDEFADGLTITPGPLRSAAIDTYNDHRMAMSLALVGLKVSGVVIRNPACVAKTYPEFFRDLECLR